MSHTASNITVTAKTDEIRCRKQTCDPKRDKKSFATMFRNSKLVEPQTGATTPMIPSGLTCAQCFNVSLMWLLFLFTEVGLANI